MCISYADSLPFVNEDVSQIEGASYGESGTCIWEIDQEGTLTIRPINGDEGILDEWDAYAPWYESRLKINTVKFEGRIKAKTCRGMFLECNNITSIDFHGLDTSNVTDMESMFYRCGKLTELDLKGFDTSNVTNMAGMFSACEELRKVDLSSFDTSNVTSMAHMFSRNNSLVSVDVSGFCTNNVTTMAGMFGGCSSLTSLDLSNFDMTNVEDTTRMFDECPITLEDTSVGTNPKQGTYTIEASLYGNGKITPSGTTKVDRGDSQKYKMTPDDGYTLTLIIVDGKTIKDVDTYTFKNVKESHTIFARFDKIKEEEKKEEKKEDKDLTIEERFSDVKESDWFYESIQYVYDNQLMNGMPNNKFEPRSNMNRGMLVTVLYRASKSTEQNRPTYTDVDSMMYYVNPVAWAAKHGIVNGMGNNEFAPNNNITREQIVTILYRYAKFMDNSIEDMEGVMGLVGYEDYGEVSEYAIFAFRWAIHEGIITGKGEGLLAPKDLATRAEVATMLMRFLEQ